MSDRIVTREILNDWICNDGLDHLFEEGYLSMKVVDPDDQKLRVAVDQAHKAHKTYLLHRDRVQDLVDEVAE